LVKKYLIHSIRRDFEDHAHSLVLVHFFNKTGFAASLLAVAAFVQTLPVNSTDWWSRLSPSGNGFAKSPSLLT
jgi:hypothetical protein